ncbi:MAG: hypothetical protein PHE84_12615 [bacterium]|nr:hypothetical protein [bacterium]
MNENLAQTIAIVTYGNAYLKTGNPKYADISNTHSAFQFVQELKFVGHKKKSTLQNTFLNTRDWFDAIRRKQGQYLFLGYVADAMGSRPNFKDTAYANTRLSNVLVHYKYSNEVWRPIWESGASDQLLEVVAELSGKKPPVPKSRKKKVDPEQPWSVQYLGENTDMAFIAEDLPNDIAEDRKNLTQALTDIKSFCRKAKLPKWEDVFQKALSRLTKPLPPGKFPGDLLPDIGYLPSVRQLSSVCEEAWVFGGMGSWSDMIFKTKKINKEYEDVSQKLFLTVVDGLIHSAVAFGRKDV